MTGTGVAVALIVMVLEYLGVSAETEVVDQIVAGVVGVMILVGQVTRADLKWGLLRK